MAMAIKESEFRIPKLEEDNFYPWSVRVKAALIHKGAWAAIEPGYPAEAVLTADQETLNCKALAFLMLVVSDNHLNDIGECTRAKEAWRILEEMYSSYGLLHQILMLRELFNIKKSEETTVQDYIGNIQSSYRKISRVGIDFPDQTLALVVLMGLPMERYESFVRSLEREEEKLTVQSVKSKLLLEEKRLKRNEEDETREETVRAMTAVRRNANSGKKKLRKWKLADQQNEDDSRPMSNLDSQETPNCYTCGKLGHFARACPEFKEFLNQKALKEGTAKCVRSEMDELTEKIRYAYCSVGNKSELKKKLWYLDSCSSDHMSPLKADFITLEESNYGIIKMGNGDEAKILGKGTVKVKVAEEDGGHIVSLSETLYVPELECALMSVSKLTDKRLDVVFSGEKGVVIDGDKIIFRAKKKERVYIVNTAGEGDRDTQIGSLDHESTPISGVACRAVSNLGKWHSRLGHLHEEALLKIPMLARFKGKEKLEECETCILAKAKKSPFFHKSTRVDKPLDRIHSDVMQIKPASIGGANFVVTFLDNHTNFVVAIPIKRKSEVMSEFMKFQKRAENVHNKKVLELQTDNGGEYLSNEFIEYLKKEGILHRLTVPRNPQQNGKAERMNGVLSSVVRSLLIHSGCPHKFWAEALNTASYLRNLSPSSSIKNQIPMELWTGRKLDAMSLSHLRVFGCLAWAKKDDAGKLDEQAERCVFLGYQDGVKGYRLWSLSRNKAFVSRDVRFQEDIFPFKVSLQDKDTFTKEPEYIRFNMVDEETENGAGENLNISGVAEELQEMEDDDNVALPQPFLLPDEDQQGGSASQEPSVRRSNREPKPKHCGCCNAAIYLDGKIPSTVKEALCGKNADHWRKAIDEELQKHTDQGTWKFTKRCPGTRVIGCKWVFTTKENEDGTIKFKARLVAQGFKQCYGIDYFDTSSPVIEKKSIRLLTYLAVEHGWRIDHVDVTGAYLNSELNETVFMEIPDGLNVDKSKFVCELIKSLYGLKQSGRNFFEFVSTVMTLKLEFKKCTSDPCIYFKDGIIVGTYVDDFYAVGETEKVLKFKEDIGKIVKVKDLGPVSSFLSIQFDKPEKDIVMLSQSQYINFLLDEFSLSDCKGVTCPLPVGSNFAVRGEGESFDKEIYQKAVGSLLYLSTCTRPDIANAVCRLSQCSSSPSVENWKGVKSVLKYLKKTIDYKLTFRKGGKFSCFCDADWAGDKLDSKSVTGYVVTIGGGAIAWKSRKQKSVATSSVHAEYIALYECACELIWLKSLLNELGFCHLLPTTFEINCDNQGAIAISKCESIKERSKHFAVKYHYLRELVEEKLISPVYVPSAENSADLLTKSLAGPKVRKFASNIGLRDDTY